MNPTAIFSKTGKGVQEASGKTSNLSRADRAVLKEIDGKTQLQNIAVKFEKLSADKFDALIAQFDKDGYIREVSSGAAAPQTQPPRSAPPPKAPPPAASDGGDEMDFTQAIKLPPKAPASVDLAAASRADAERKAKEQQGFDYKARQEAEAKAKAESEARARAESQARAAAEAKARADAEARTRAEADAKVKSARDAAVRMATEAKAKAEADAKAKSDASAERERDANERARRESEDKARLEADLNAKLGAERKAREDAERRAAEAAGIARKELEEKAKRDAEELRQRLEAEMKTKLEEERKAREAEDRKRREEEDRKRAEEDRKRREEDERRRKEEAERRAKEDAERRAREEEERKHREEDARRRKEEEALRAKEAGERRARDEADRKRREEEDRKRAEEEKRRKDDEARRAKEEADRRAKDEADRRARDEADRRAKDEAARKAKEEADARARAAQSASLPSIPPVTPPPAAAGGSDIGDSLLADLESFGQREDEEQKAKEEAERKAKEDAARKAEAERQASDAAERRAKEEAERKRREEAERKAQEEAEQLAREGKEREEQEEAGRKRKATEAFAAKEAERKAARRAAAEAPAKSAAKDDDDIGVTDDDLGMDDIKKDEKAMSATVRKAQREREQAAAIAAAPAPRPKKWGMPAAIALFVLLIGGVGVLQLMPVSTAEYEKAASDAMGVPVKIASARLSVITGIEARFDSVSVGDSVKIKTVRGYPEVGSLFGGKKSFSRIELEGVTLSQSQLADAVLGKVSGENFRVARILVKQAKLDGPITLPALDVEAVVAGDGSLQSVSLRGGDKLVVQLAPKGSDIGFEISAGSLALPFAPALTLSDFGMKGTANRTGVTASEFDGRAFDGVMSGTAKIRWGASWTVDGEVRARGMKVAVLAPALVSEGKVDGRGNYAMSGADPAKLFDSARIQGEFKIDKGVLGSFDLTRALQTGGAQTSGRTIFSELTGQAVYDKGAVKITNASITAGAMNAGASLDIDANGGLSGRVVADVKTPNQTLRATLNVSGKLQDPVIRK